MPSYNRARQYNRSGGLVALLEGILGGITEGGIQPNMEVGPTPSGATIDQTTPFKATNWLARPQVNRMNNEMLMDLKMEEERFGKQKELVTHGTNERVRGREKEFPIREKEQEADYGRQERGNVAAFGRQEKGKITAQHQAVLQAMGLPYTEENLALVDNILTEPRVASALSAENLKASTSEAGLEQLKESEGLRLQSAPSKARIAELQGRKAEGELAGDIELQPFAKESKKQMFKLAPREAQTGINRGNLLTVPEGATAYSAETLKPLIKPLSEREKIGGVSTPDGGYSAKATQNTPDVVTNVGQPPTATRGEWVFDPATGEAVNIKTKKRIKLEP